MTPRPILIALSAPVAEAPHPGARVASLPLAEFAPLPENADGMATVSEEPGAAGATPRVFTSLAALAPDGRMVVRRIDTEPGFARRLMELGLLPGSEAMVVRRAPFGDPIEIAVRGTHFSIRKSEAERIHGEAI